MNSSEYKWQRACAVTAPARRFRYGLGMSMHAQQPASTEPYVIRKATADDVDTVAAIWHVGWKDGHVGHVPPELLPYRHEQQFLSRARKRLEDMWVAESRGQPIGFVVVKGDEVEQLYVDRAARGTGAAAMLLRRGEAEIRSAGHRRAWLAVVAGNQRARSFYSRLGWRDAGPMSYLAETEAGPFAVPTHRYEIDLTDPGATDPLTR
jgi:ribosomal protein S18 acetylase RimI-like enzyme